MVIYAAYGSNLLKDRFMVYIYGGTYRNRNYKGCTDITPPKDLGWQFVPHRLYFAKHSSLWNNGGVAFLTCEKESCSDYHAVVRLWQITQNQFEEIHNQEGKVWYYRILSLGNKDGLEIKTFTGCWSNELNTPCEDYLYIISKGLKETTGWSDKEIESYLIRMQTIIP